MKKTPIFVEVPLVTFREEDSTATLNVYEITSFWAFEFVTRDEIEKEGTKVCLSGQGSEIEVNLSYASFKSLLKDLYR